MLGVCIILESSLVQVARLRKTAAMAVHFYTATGVVWAMLAMLAIVSGQFKLAFFWLAIAAIVDATDGPMARKIRIKETAPNIDGRKLDDIADYLNYTFLPLLLLWYGEWLPKPAWVFVGIPLIASLFAFANVGAKEEDDGFFLGFPSYWNVFAFYVAIWLHQYGTLTVAAITLFFSALSVMPVRFVYPNRAKRFRLPLMWGGWTWVLIGFMMLALYPSPPILLIACSLLYPTLYVVLSFWLARTRHASPRP